MRPSPILPRLAAALLTCALAAAPARADDPSGTSELPPIVEDVGQTITVQEAAINHAYATNDLKTYFSYYAPDLRAIFPDGPTTLAAYRADWEKLIASGGKVEHFRFSDLRVQVSPDKDAAVASYVADVKVVGPDGKPSDNGKFYETDVWFKRGKAWQIVETHYSKAN